MRKRWRSIEENLLRELYPIEATADLLFYFPEKTIDAIKTKAIKMGLSKVEVFFEFRKEQIVKLIETYADTRSEDIAKQFGCDVNTIYRKANQLGLKKSDEFVAENARKNFTEDHPARRFNFKKGHTPFTQGKKQTEYLSPEALERTVATRFKPGQKVWNTKPIGYERINVDGYIEVKIEEPNKFKGKHRLIWEQHFGEIPKGHNVQFRDGNRQNVDIENLYLISRSEQLRNENSLIVKYPKELQLAIHSRSVLSRQINKILKQETK